jgi:hypothetical protein
VILPSLSALPPPSLPSAQLPFMRSYHDGLRFPSAAAVSLDPKNSNGHIAPRNLSPLLLLLLLPRPLQKISDGVTVRRTNRLSLLSLPSLSLYLSLSLSLSLKSTTSHKRSGRNISIRVKCPASDHFRRRPVCGGGQQQKKKDFAVSTSSFQKQQLGWGSGRDLVIDNKCNN